VGGNWTNFDTDVSGASGVGLECHSILRHLEPSIKALSPLKCTELTQLEEHFKLTVANAITSSAKKGEIRQLIINYSHEEELVSDQESEETSAIALQRLELEERAKEREAELK